jgi:O-antigen ligase
MALSILAAIISSIYAVNDFRTGNLLLGNERIRGFVGNLFDNPNDLALYLVTMIPLVLAMGLGTKAISKKILYIGLALLFAAGIVATTSRGGLIGLAAVMGALGWKLARRYRVVMGGIGLGLIFLIVLFGPGGLKSRIAAGNDGSAVSRTDDLKRSVFLSIRHPLVGLGMSCYPLYSNTAHATHNGFTQVSVELGAPALVFYVLFLVIPIGRLAKMRRDGFQGKRRTAIEYLMIGLETSIIGYMVTSFFLSVAFLWYAYYLVGYAIVLRRLAEQKNFGSVSTVAKNTPETLQPMSRVMARDSL